LVLQLFYIADDDFHLLARKDIRHRLSENVGPLLIEQAGRESGIARCFINRTGLFAAFDSSVDGAVADEHGHVIDRGLVRERKSVDRLNLFLVWILKLLRDSDPGQEAG